MVSNLEQFGELLSPITFSLSYVGGGASSSEIASTPPGGVLSYVELYRSQRVRSETAVWEGK